MNEVSIVIPMYNSEKSIERCLNSIKLQTYHNYEIIIIDDGSTDGSLLVCEKFKKINDKILFKIIKQKNKGPSAARNIGIENASGKYIIFVDCDDYLEEDFIEKLLNNHEEKVMVRSNYKVKKNNKILEIKHEKGVVSIDCFIKKILDGSFVGCVWGCLFETKILKKIQFDLDLYFMEDSLFLIKYVYNLEYVKFVDTNYIYCLNLDSITSSKRNVLNNIISFTKSLDIINDVTNHNYNNNIDNKKIILIEKEISKINKCTQLKKIVNNNTFIEIMSKIKKINIKKNLYKLYFDIINNKNYVLLYLYNIVRKLLKKIKNMI